MFKKIIFTLFIVGLLGLIATGSYIGFHFTKTYQGPDKSFTVLNGDTFGKVNQRLFNDGLISNRRIFHYYAKFNNYLTKFRAGNFTITRGSTMSQILETLVYGQPNLTSITIPEGKNMYEIAKLFASAGITGEQDFLEIVQHPDFISQLKIQATTLEGYLYPETYHFAPETPAKTVVKTMIDLFNRRTESIDFKHPFFE